MGGRGVPLLQTKSANSQIPNNTFIFYQNSPALSGIILSVQETKVSRWAGGWTPVCWAHDWGRSAEPKAKVLINFNHIVRLYWKNKGGAVLDAKSQRKGWQEWESNEVTKPTVLFTLGYFVSQFKCSDKQQVLVWSEEKGTALNISRASEFSCHLFPTFYCRCMKWKRRTEARGTLSALR